MFAIALSIGIYSYLIFLAGLFGLINKPALFLISLGYILFLLIFCFRKNRHKHYSNFKVSLFKKIISNNKLSVFLVSILLLQIAINFIGALGPEISFDALWYHLTLPKLYILSQQIFYIPGNQLYYSVMPKLTEMLYTTAMVLSNEILAKIIHFGFGILVLGAIYKIAQKYMSNSFAILASVIFYSNLVVGWESITAYVDLARTFFEVIAFWGFLQWLENRKVKNIVLIGLMLGLAITTKLITVESLVIFFLLFAYMVFLKKETIIGLIKNFSIVALISFLIPLPWFIFSYINTHNPFYPYFSNIPVDSGNTIVLANPLHLFSDVYNMFLRLNDPISPIYLIVLPLIIIMFKKFDYKVKLLAIYSFLGILAWYLFLEQRGSRFFMPYLPVVSILTAYVVYKLKNINLRTFLIGVAIVVSLASIGYRVIANAKFIPVIIGRETQNQFLSKYLNFSFGDFADTDGYFQSHIKPSDKILLFGFHNLYYVDFPFVDSSWVKRGDKFNYIAVQNSRLPDRFSDWKEIYYNQLTKVKLYSNGGRIWVY